MDTGKLKYLALILFAFAFLYMFTFTVDVDPHWESHLFITGSFDLSPSYIFNEIFRVGSERGTASHGPVNAVYHRTLFTFFGYNWFFWRIAKSLFFAGAVLCFFLICNRFLKREYALAASAFALFSFPVFIQTLVFDEGFIIGEFFKIFALYLFHRSGRNIAKHFSHSFAQTFYHLVFSAVPIDYRRC